jgi:hypothetical protein
MIRQIWRESECNNTMISDKYAYGCAQLKRYHDALMRTAEHYNKTVPIAEQYFWIYPSVETMCALMADFLEQYKGDYNLALVAYAYGANSSSMTNYRAGKWKLEDTTYYKAVMIDGWIEKYNFGL